MSKASEQLAARAARTAARGTGEPTAASQPSRPEPASIAAVPRGQPVRITVDLAPLAHRELLDVCRDAAERCQLPKVPTASLVRALLVQLREDPELLGRMLPDLRRDADENRRRK